LHNGPSGWILTTWRSSIFGVVAKIVCPQCKAVITAARQELPTWPFCSARCRSADLGSWLNDAYRISSPVAEEDLDQGLSAGSRDDNEEDPPS
jgi:endogenous inhibitor of DNA gyrase (YacG/DUF329 family)